MALPTDLFEDHYRDALAAICADAGVTSPTIAMGCAAYREAQITFRPDADDHRPAATAFARSYGNEHSTLNHCQQGTGR